MIWADRVAQDIIASCKYKPYWVDDMKTPSGRIHVGSLRGVVMHDLIYKTLHDAGQKATFSYVFDDHDPMDALPVYLDSDKWGKYLGQPLFTIPSPDAKAENYARYFAGEFKDVFNSIGCNPKIIWASTLYKTGKMNDEIRLCLDKVSIIRKIYATLYKKKIADDWFPFQVVCPNCGKESTTKVTSWDGKTVTFCCNVDAVTWTQGCGICGKTSPFSGDGKFVGKLSWKVEWAVKWKVIGITIEGAGKDHMGAGGSHDVASQVAEKVINYPTPYGLAHEFFLIGGKKMSSSKGVGSSAREVADSLPPYLLRFLMVRTHIKQAIDFDPGGMTIPDLFDEYDRCAYAYFDKTDEDLGRIFELSQTNGTTKKKLFLPRFRDVASFIQMPSVNLEKRFEEKKGSKLTNTEKEILEHRIQYARLWLARSAPEEFKVTVAETLPEAAKNLTGNQKEYLQEIAKQLEKKQNAEELQQTLFNLAKSHRLSTKEAFQAIYTALFGKPAGPKAASFLLSLDKNFVKRRFEEVSKISANQEIETHIFPILNQPELFSIDKAIKQRYPSIVVGIAIIKNVTIKKQNPELQQEIDGLLQSFEGITTEQLSKFPEIQSYRRIYKEMGIDWHSRRPSPEALLRRIATGKGLYSVNTCVDAYNLVVMKNRVSVGAFAQDRITFPTVLRFAKAGEKIHLLGDQEPTEYKEGEIAYFDQIGGYNMDFNYRDAQRTMVTEKTKNLWINIEGVYEITREQVEKTLQETIEMIAKYCGGKVELVGIVTVS